MIFGAPTDASAQSGSRLIVDQKRRLTELERQQQKLLDAYMADALPVEVLKERQHRVGVEIADAKRLIEQTQIANDEVIARLEQVIELLRHAERLYNMVGDDARQLLNTAVFTEFHLDSETDDPDSAPVAAYAP